MLRRIQNFLNAQALERFLKENKFDTILSTHFFPNEVCANLKRKGKINSKIVSVITDFDVHSIWLAKGIDQYAVASQWTKEKMKRMGVDENTIVVTGIPTDQKFSLNRERTLLKKNLDLKHDVFTVLVATGSFGIGPIEEIIDALQGMQVLVVCGHNKGLYQRLKSKNKDLVYVYPLVDNMDELMGVADVMVTKPGGLSISEALVSQLPLIFFNAIPGQETNNIRVLQEHGIGISDCSVEEIAKVLKELNSSRDKYLTTIKRTNLLACPNAVNDIISLINERQR